MKKIQNIVRRFRRTSQIIFLICVIGAICGLTASAQTNLPALPVNNITFFQSLQAYFTTFNPELESTFASNNFCAWAGVSSVQGAGVPLQNEIGFSATVKKSFSTEVVFHDAGVAGVIVNVQAGPAFNFVVHDTKLTLYGHGGYNISSEVDGDRVYGEFGVRVQKALTKNTFAGLGMGVQVPRGTRVFTVFTGFVF